MGTMTQVFNPNDLGRTYFIDIDGTLVQHIDDPNPPILPGVIDFLRTIRPQDVVIFTTARKESLREETENLLANICKPAGITYKTVIYEVGVGPRIVVNDTKPWGQKTAFAINVTRDKGFDESHINFAKTHLEY